MQTRKMYERINWYKKEYVHEQYSRIVEHFKDYDKITKKKMLESIYKVYNDSNNIIDICTTRELKYLKMLLDKKNNMKDLLGDKYEWERKILRNKFLVQDDYNQVFIPDEIIDKVRMAIKNINWDVTKKLDDLNEILVSYCKIQASALLNSVSAFGSAVTGIDEKYIKTHMLNNKLFNYYVLIYTKDFETIGNNILVCLYQDYYSIEEELEEELSITSEFKKGFRDLVIIAKYEKEYTAVMNRNKTYMIKGLNDNIDNIISYQDLPQPVMTSIIPFKNVLIYDGLLMELGIKMGISFEKVIEKEYSKSIKYYYL